MIEYGMTCDEVKGLIMTLARMQASVLAWGMEDIGEESKAIPDLKERMKILAKQIKALEAANDHHGKKEKK